MGCYSCRYFQERIVAGHVICEQGDGIQVIGAAEMGCAFWEREPGSDDE